MQVRSPVQVLGRSTTTSATADTSPEVSVVSFCPSTKKSFATPPASVRPDITKSGTVLPINELLLSLELATPATTLPKTQSPLTLLKGLVSTSGFGTNGPVEVLPKWIAAPAGPCAVNDGIP